MKNAAAKYKIKFASRAIKVNTRYTPEWPQDKVEQLTFLVGLGLSGREVAARMKISRSKALGKIIRLGLVLARKAGWQSATAARLLGGPSERKPAQRRKAGVRTAPAGLTELRTIPLICEPVGILEIAGNLCRYPVDGHGADIKFCGAQQVDGASYCSGHAYIAFLPARDAPSRYARSLRKYA